jgi:hypothetical protein
MSFVDDKKIRSVEIVSVFVGNGDDGVVLWHCTKGFLKIAPTTRSERRLEVSQACLPLSI